MFRNQTFKWAGWLLSAILLMVMLSSCGTSKKMGCPMEFSQVHQLDQSPVSVNWNAYASDRRSS